MLLFLPDLIKQPVKWADPLFAVWNLCLQIFSIWGLLNTAITLGSITYHEGIHYTLCYDPFAWDDAVGQTTTIFRPGLGLLLFIFSKVFELGDTFFLILKNKDIKVIQWYHHTTVMLFCWLALATEYAPGMWFAALNYAIHSLMYGYFFASYFESTRICRNIIGPHITTLQIVQMVLGLLVTAGTLSFYFRLVFITNPPIFLT